MGVVPPRGRCADPIEKIATLAAWRVGVVPAAGADPIETRRQHLPRPRRRQHLSSFCQLECPCTVWLQVEPAVSPLAIPNAKNGSYHNEINLAQAKAKHTFAESVSVIGRSRGANYRSGYFCAGPAT
ncbi:hypothetical protein ON010_g414 [Phytophthora cinnamomi]|nr:hypothetical protein ON010_g414 [Phytophthora cinnamomi]